jgi:Tol biopolymer transport system component
MSGDLRESGSAPAEFSSGDRLDSWKQIANYLKRDIRTVQRWEKDEALPVRRHLHRTRGSVYAFKVELDAWWSHCRSHLQEEPRPSGKEKWRATWVWCGIAAAVILVLGGLAMWRLNPGQPPKPRLRVVPLTNYPGIEEGPVFSADGKQVAFSWNGEKQDNFDIYVKAISAGKPLRLTTDPAADGEPAWSPDGQWIAFLRQQPAAGKFAVFVIPALGGSERKIAEIDLAPFVAHSHLSWTPDGNGLIVVDRITGSSRHALFLLSTDTVEKRRLTSPPALHYADCSPAVAPDSRTLAFVRSPAVGVGEIWLQPLSSDYTARGEPKQLTFGGRYISNLAWTADGREIFYMEVREGSPVLWRIGVSGASPPKLVHLFTAPTRKGSFAITRDGNRLAYSQVYLSANIWRMELRPRLGQPRNPVRLLSSTRIDANARFSPDGKRIAFGSTRSGSFEIWVSENDGSNPVQLTSFGGPMTGTGRWSPDGKQIAFDCVAGGNGDIYIVSAGGGKPRRLTTDPATDDSPSWSRDGKWIYFGSNRRGLFQIWKMPAEGGSAVQVTRNGGYSGFESPDGKFLYYARDHVNTSLWRVPAEGGEEVKILDELAGSDFFDVADDGIYFLPFWEYYPSRPPPIPVQFHRFGARNSETVGEIWLQPTLGFSVSPDKRGLMFSTVETLGSDVVVLENLP